MFNFLRNRLFRCYLFGQQESSKIRLKLISSETRLVILFKWKQYFVFKISDFNMKAFIKIYRMCIWKLNVGMFAFIFILEEWYFFMISRDLRLQKYSLIFLIYLRLPSKDTDFYKRRLRGDIPVQRKKYSKSFKTDQHNLYNFTFLSKYHVYL